MYHSSISAEYYAGPYGPIRVDLEADYSARCRAVLVMEQFRKVLGVIGWVAATDHLRMWPMNAEPVNSLFKKIFSEAYLERLVNEVSKH